MTGKKENPSKEVSRIIFHFKKVWLGSGDFISLWEEILLVLEPAGPVTSELFAITVEISHDSFSYPVVEQHSIIKWLRSESQPNLLQQNEVIFDWYIYIYNNMENRKEWLYFPYGLCWNLFFLGVIQTQRNSSESISKGFKSSFDKYFKECGEHI